MTEKKLTKKEMILEYLQENAISLRTSIPSLADAKYEKGKLVLVVRGEVIEAPELVHKGVQLPVAIEVTYQEPEPVAELSEAAERANEIRSRAGVIPVDGLYIHSAEPAVGPKGTGERRNQEAYEAWQKRFGKK